MDDFTWLDDLLRRGWGGPLETALDALEPLGPLAAQLLWMVQPMSRLAGGVGAARAVQALATALETPAGLAALRTRLAAGAPPPDDPA